MFDKPNARDARDEVGASPDGARMASNHEIQGLGLAGHGHPDEEVARHHGLESKRLRFEVEDFVVALGRDQPPDRDSPSSR
jgi:hypothetical protein